MLKQDRSCSNRAGFREFIWRYRHADFPVSVPHDGKGSSRSELVKVEMLATV